MYSWKVDEVSDEGTYPGELWSFATREYEFIDDFESYTDDADAELTIWQAWIDGITTEASGSQVGYMEAPFAERSIVHGGSQSMPLMYDNTGSPFYYSRAERDFDSAQNWAVNGATELSLWTQGYPSITTLEVTETGGKMTLVGQGADIWGTSDEFVYAFKTLTGNGTMVRSRR